MDSKNYYHFGLIFFFHFIVFFLIYTFPSDKSKTLEYIFPQVKAFFYLLEKEIVSYSIKK